MYETTTPYVKIEQQRNGGFGDLPIDTEPSHPSSQPSSEETVSSIANHEWDSLFHWDLESCFVSFSIPCHVVGKIGTQIGVGYTYLFLLYAFFFCIFNYCYYIFVYATHPICNHSQFTNACLFINDKHSCSKSYMKLDNDDYMCYYDHTYNVCFRSEHQCISSSESKIIWSSWAFLQATSCGVITMIHLYIRRNLKHKQKIHQDMICKDLFYSLYCSTCSLAQQYRALDTNNDILV